MDRLYSTFRDSPALIAILVFLAITAGLGVIFAFALQRSGGSLKPLVFFFGFLAIVAVPQGAVHLLDALVQRRAGPAEESPRPEAPPEAVPVSTTASVPWSQVFGPNANPALITDARVSLSDIFAPAEEARLSFSAEGTSALAARFPDASAAGQAFLRYVAFFRLPPSPSDPASRTGRRYEGQGEWNHVVLAGSELYAWTGPTPDHVANPRIRALGSAPVLDAPAPGPAGEPSAPPSSGPVSGRLSRNVPLMSAFLVINLAAAVGWFFKASAWAARTPPNPAVSAVPAGELEARLRALARDDTPWQLTPGDRAGTWIVTWRYSDARWLDWMRLRAVRRTHRLELEPDPSTHTVRVVEYSSAFDVSAGAGGADLRWRQETGLTFFQFETRRVAGLVLGPDGRPTGELSTGFTFDLQALKAPFAATITDAGWTWQPVVWNGPRSLRWLTE